MNKVETFSAEAPVSLYPDFVSIVEQLIHSVDRSQLEEMRRDFHTRLRITLTQPESAELIEDLWDFFYDWCLFERKLPEQIKNLPDATRVLWEQVKQDSLRGIYTVQKMGDDHLKIKDLFTGKTFSVEKKQDSDFIGISKGDILEGRLMPQPLSNETDMKLFVRKPSYHPTEVHEYIKSKVKQFKKEKDFETYQNWLWLLVGMYLKHRIYQHMPIEKIYDDNSRI